METFFHCKRHKICTSFASLHSKNRWWPERITSVFCPIKITSPQATGKNFHEYHLISLERYFPLFTNNWYDCAKVLIAGETAAISSRNMVQEMVTENRIRPLMIVCVLHAYLNKQSRLFWGELSVIILAFKLYYSETMWQYTGQLLIINTNRQ